MEELKKVALVGAGRIGTIVADHIIQKRDSSLFGKFFEKTRKRIAQDFVIVDSDEELCKQASERFPNANIFCADITDEGFIQEEGLDKFNLVICATHNHELNMVVSAYLESLGVEKTISLVANSAFGEIARKLGVDVAVPIRDAVVDSIMSHLRGKAVTGIHTVSSGDMEIIECDLPSSSKVVGKTLKDISSPGEYLILLIKKLGSDQYDIPIGNTVLTVGDHLVLIANTGDKKVLEKFSGTK
jgi:trk system potassium uptake protein TrkA